MALARRSPPASRLRAGRGLRSRAAAAGRTPGEEDESRQVLDAFFLGKALADTVTDRLGAAVGDALAEAAKFDAERREELRQFQEEVLERARREMYATAAEPVPLAPQAPPPAGGSTVRRTGDTEKSAVPAANVPDTPPVDLADAVDSLRSEVARTNGAVASKKP